MTTDPKADPKRDSKKVPIDPIVKKDLTEVIEELDISSMPIESSPEAYQIEALKKDEKEMKMPVKREDDKRRLGKGLTKFIDDKVDDEFLDGMPEEIQELMKK